MDKQEAGRIQKITMGDPKEGFSFHTGQILPLGNNKLRIVSIIRDENNFHYFGCVRYLIWAKKEDSEIEFIWKYIENQPVILTCFCPEDKN